MIDEVKPPPSMTEADMVDLLRKRYPAQEYAVVAGVRSQAGFDAKREADALAMAYWTSAGNELHGFEIKVSRSDWLVELKEPAKAQEGWMPYCHRWWLVTSPDVAKLDELPATWGLLVAHGAVLRVKRAAPLLDAAPMRPAVLAVLVKAIMNQAADGDTIQRRITAGREEGYRAGKKAGLELAAEGDSVARNLKGCQDLVAAMEAEIEAFKKGSGLGWPCSWERGQHARLGAAVRCALEMGTDGAVRTVLEDAARSLDAVAARLRGELAALPLKPGDPTLPEES